MNPQLRPLFEAATRPYVGAGTFAWRFAEASCATDPVFFFLLRRGLLPDRERACSDLGCGRGILLSLLKAAKEQYQAGVWPLDWPVPPVEPRLRGIELSESRACEWRVARLARQVVQATCAISVCSRVP